MEIINSRDLNTNGTRFLQSVRATYWELVEAFGHPTYADPEYLDDKLNTLWNIGGHGQRVASKIIDILEKREVA